jgi:hypothetical protein
MLNSGHREKSVQPGNLVRRTSAQAETPPAEVDDAGLSKFWTEKYRFNLSKLRLNKEKARAWATRAVRVKLETANMEVMCSHH